MKFFLSKKFLVLLSFIFLLFLIIICKPSKPSAFGLYRFTDNLTEKSIIESPLKDILKSFKKTEEDFVDRWTHLPSISGKEQDVWAVSSQYPILGLDESEKPDGMKVTRDGKEIDFVTDTEKIDESWGWLSPTKRKKIRKYPQFSKKYGGIVLREGDTFSFEELLPDGEAMLLFNISEIRCEDCTPYLAVNLNSKPIKQFLVEKTGPITAVETLKLGKYNIEFKHVKPEDRAKKNRKNFIVIKSIRIKTKRDIILLFLRREKEKRTPPEKYHASYFTYVSESEEETALIKATSLSLYALEEKYSIRDFGIDENPYAIIKKARIGDYSLNCLFAQPKSQFVFEVNLPEECYLEFGYGTLEESLKKADNEVHFRVELETKNARELLFSKGFKPSKERQVIYEKIDLFSYAGEKVKIYFITESGAAEEEKSSQINNSYAIWVNPILHRPSPEKEVNFVLLSIDTLRPDHMGCYGYARDTSPHMDKLAEDSVLFENTFSTTSWTLPAHVSLVTSLNTPSHRVNNTRQVIPTAAPTLADVLRKENFLCSAFTGGGFLSSRYGFAKGFDSYQEMRKRGEGYTIRIDEAEALSGRVSDWLDGNYEKQFFLFLHTYQPHTPYWNESEEGKMFLAEDAKWMKIVTSEIFGVEGKYDTVLSEEERVNVIDLYDGEIRYTDEYLIKPLIEKLKELDIYDNTVIIITSDHGEEFYEHESWLHGVNLYNESLKVPLMIKLPDSLYKGERKKEIVGIVDIMPTVMELAGVKTSSFALDGESLLPIVKGKENQDRTFYSDLNIRKLKDDLPSIFATNRNSFKLILNKNIRSSYIDRVAKKVEGRKIELYDIQRDKKEIKNIATSYSHRELCVKLIEKIESLYAKLEKERAETLVIDEELKRSLRALGYIK